MKSALLFLSRLLTLFTLTALSAGIFSLQSTTPASDPHILSIPYFSIKGDWDSTLTLNNSLSEPLTVSVTLYSLKGDALPLSDFSVQQEQSVALRLSKLLADVRDGEEFQEGSIQLRYNGTVLGLGPQLTVSDSKHGLSFDMEPPMDFKSSSLEGLWWSLDEKTSGQVVFSNTTDQELTLWLNVEWQGTVIPAPSISLSAHQTVVRQIKKLLEELQIDSEGIGYGGLSLTHSGPPGALIAHGVVLNTADHFASNLNFIDPAGERSSELEATGLMLGHPSVDSGIPKTSFFTPVLAMKNTSQSPQTATVSVEYTADGKFQVGTLPAINLAPHEVRLADFSSLLDSLRDVSVDAAGLKVVSSGTPGALVAALSSIDQSGSVVVDAPVITVNANGYSAGNHHDLEGY